MVSITDKDAKAVAQEKFRQIQLESDPMLIPWRNSVIGSPTLVYTIEKVPSYWIVPVIWKKIVIGFINVELDGVVSAYGYFYRRADSLENCPSTVTWFSQEEAMKRAKDFLDKYDPSFIRQPVFVHDSAKSKRAWMISIEKRGKQITRIFVTPGLVYERTGEEQKLQEDLE